MVVGGGGLSLVRDWQTGLSNPRTLAKVKDDWSFYNLESLVSKGTVTTRNVRTADLSYMVNIAISKKLKVSVLYQ